MSFDPFRLAKEHNSDYSKIALTNQIASLISSLIPALVLVDAEEGSGGEMLIEFAQDKKIKGEEIG